MPLTIETLADVIENGINDVLRDCGIHRTVSREVHGLTCVLWIPSSDGEHALCAWCGDRLARPTMPEPDAPPGLECKLTCKADMPHLKKLLDDATAIMRRQRGRRVEAQP